MENCVVFLLQPHIGNCYLGVRIDQLFYSELLPSGICSQCYSICTTFVSYSIMKLTTNIVQY